MAQKLIQIGSSAGVTIPPSILEAMRIRVGDSIEVAAHPDQGVISITPKRKEKKGRANKDLVAWVEEAIERYRPALEALADK